MNIGKTGISGEDRVASFLRKRGAVIVKRNYSCRFGEIDIIAEYKEYILFVEVKTRKEGAMFAPADAVNYHKQNNIKSAASAYLSRYKIKNETRFDIIEVFLLDDDEYNVMKVNHIKNAF